jgi:macrolide-specific efflux system membrane fusion protein
MLLLAGAVVLIAYMFAGKKDANGQVRPVRPTREDIRITVSTTGTVYPRNRLEVMPSVAGRIEKMLVNEGDYVRKGQVLAYMSSTDRASLIDAARGQGAAAFKYWEDAYKPIPVIAPIEGTVIVRTIEPGQTVTTSTAIVVISDRLIVKASVDETDIGRVNINQRAKVSLDAHPETIASGKVSRIYYESATSNNVTVYYVQIEMDKIPSVFRSGMSANIEIVEKTIRDALLVPADAVKSDNGGKYVLVGKAPKEGEKPSGDKPSGEKPSPEKRIVTTGMTKDGNIQITSGLSEDDMVLIPSAGFVLPKSDDSKNIFMPSGPKNQKRRGGPGGPM